MSLDVREKQKKKKKKDLNNMTVTLNNLTKKWNMIIGGFTVRNVTLACTQGPKYALKNKTKGRVGLRRVLKVNVCFSNHSKFSF